MTDNLKDLVPKPYNQEPDPTPKQNKIFNRELLIRSISAVILASLALYMTQYSYLSFVAFCIIVLMLMGYEWARLTNNDSPLQLLTQLSTVLLTVTAFLLKEWPLFISAIVGGAFLSSWSTHYWWRSKWALLGLLYVTLPILSMIYLRSDPNYGFHAILFLFFVVWGTDTAAYFTGRHFGGKKLAPAISPGKTWAGFYGGLFAGLIIGALFAISINKSPIILAFIGLLLSAISQAGDLSESAIKRHFGVKDSGHLIPGHGGILDRFDGVIFAAIGAGLIALLHNCKVPGEALLFWPV